MKIKQLLSLTLAAAALTGALAGCAAKLPEEPATTKLEAYSYVDENGLTLPAPENATTQPGAAPTVVYRSTVQNVEIELSSYYIYNNTVAELSDIELPDSFGMNANGYVNVKIVSLGNHKKDGMRIGYKAYDAQGNLVRDSLIEASLDGVKAGDVVEHRRFEFPRGTVKIVFENYRES